LEASERESTQENPASRNLLRNQRLMKNPQPWSPCCSNHTPTTKSPSAELYICKHKARRRLEASKCGSTQKSLKGVDVAELNGRKVRKRQ
jgi:hypothetical protein